MNPTCHFSQNSRCTLAEQLVSKHLHLTLQCTVTDDECQRCLIKCQGKPSAAEPTLACLGTAQRLIPLELMPKWSEVATALYRRIPIANGQAQSVSPLECIHRGEVIDRYKCGCAGNQTRYIYACPVAGKCIYESAYVERAVEHLRKEGSDRSGRKVRACDACKDRTPLVQLTHQ